MGTPPPNGRRLRVRWEFLIYSIVSLGFSVVWFARGYHLGPAWLSGQTIGVASSVMLGIASIFLFVMVVRHARATSAGFDWGPQVDSGSN